MSAYNLLNTVLAFSFPAAKFRPRTSLPTAKRSSSLYSLTCSESLLWTSSIVNPPAQGCLGSTISKRCESV